MKTTKLTSSWYWFRTSSVVDAADWQLFLDGKSSKNKLRNKENMLCSISECDILVWKLIKEDVGKFGIRKTI